MTRSVPPRDASAFLQDHFQPSDRLAMVLVNKRCGDVVQRLAKAEEIASPDIHAWLLFKNSSGYEVYLSMNALHDHAQGRTKEDVGAIRHIFLDFDVGGTAAVDRLLRRRDLPEPNELVSTSPGKWQVLWKVDDFAPEQAERLQRGLARECGADIAATDCARVLRVPGFYNHKYVHPYLVRSEPKSATVSRPGQFPDFRDEAPARSGIVGRSARVSVPKAALSQSEKDWAYALRALARGESAELIESAIASLRRYDKANPIYYARLTVQKAIQHMRATVGERSANNAPDR